MDEQTVDGVRKTYKYTLKPTSEQERMLERTLMLCRHVYNAAIGERREAWQTCGVSVTYYQQKAELPGIKEAMPEYGEVHSQVLHIDPRTSWTPSTKPLARVRKHQRKLRYVCGRSRKLSGK